MRLSTADLLKHLYVLSRFPGLVSSFVIKWVLGMIRVVKVVSMVLTMSPFEGQLVYKNMGLTLTPSMSHSVEKAFMALFLLFYFTILGPHNIDADIRHSRHT